MKYYIGRLVVFRGLEDWESFSDACIAAANEAQGRVLLDTRAQAFLVSPSRLGEDGCYRFKGHDDLAVRPGELIEISAVTFQEMSKVLPVFGDVQTGDFKAQAADERTKTLARRIGEQLAKQGERVKHGRLLHAIAASLGETDWHVLSSRTQPKTASASTPELVEDEPAAQPHVPGRGFLWQVPVSVDTSMTAHVLVRATDRDEAVLTARKFAAEGQVKFEVDDANYRGLADHYCPDDSEDGVFRVNEEEAALLQPGSDTDDVNGVQRGAYLVELCNLGDGEHGLLWADLTVFDPKEDEPDTESCQSACPESASPQEQFAFCRRVADLLHRAVPDPSRVDMLTLRQVFTEAVQGEQDDKELRRLEAKLRAVAR